MHNFLGLAWAMHAKRVSGLSCSAGPTNIGIYNHNTAQSAYFERFERERAHFKRRQPQEPTPLDVFVPPISPLTPHM